MPLPRIPAPDVDETTQHQQQRRVAEQLEQIALHPRLIPRNAARVWLGLDEVLPVVPAPDVTLSPLAAAQGFREGVHVAGLDVDEAAGRFPWPKPLPVVAHPPRPSCVWLDEKLEEPPLPELHRYSIIKGGEIVERGDAFLRDGVLEIPTELRLQVGDSVTIDPTIDPEVFRAAAAKLRDPDEQRPEGTVPVALFDGEPVTVALSPVGTARPTGPELDWWRAWNDTLKLEQPTKRPGRRKLQRKIDKLRGQVDRQAFTIADLDNNLALRASRVHELTAEVETLTAELEAALRLPHPAEAGWPDRVIDRDGRVWARVARIGSAGTSFWQCVDEPERRPTTIKLHTEHGPVRRPRASEL